MRPRLKRVQRAAVLTLTVVGFADVLGRAVLAPSTGEFFGLRMMLPHGVRIERIATSLSGRYKAVVLSEEGSGLDPHCTTIVSVVASSWTVAASWASRNRVYVAECARDIELVWAPDAEALLTGKGSARDRLLVDADPSQAWSVSRVAEGGGVFVSFRSSNDSPRPPLSGRGATEQVR